MSECYIDGPPDATAACGDCDWTGPIDECEMVADIQERIFAGEEVPAGQCPECGALCGLIGQGVSHDRDELRKKVDSLSGLLSEAESFIAGFEGDECQEDPVDPLLDRIRTAIEAWEKKENDREKARHVES